MSDNAAREMNAEVYTFCPLHFQYLSKGHSPALTVLSLIDRIRKPTTGITGLRTLRLNDWLDGSSDSMELYHVICQQCPYLESLHLDGIIDLGDLTPKPIVSRPLFPVVLMKMFGISTKKCAFMFLGTHGNADPAPKPTAPIRICRGSSSGCDSKSNFPFRKSFGVSSSHSGL